jgi:hypothetical protein
MQTHGLSSRAIGMAAIDAVKSVTTQIAVAVVANDAVKSVTQLPWLLSCPWSPWSPVCSVTSARLSLL